MSHIPDPHLKLERNAQLTCARRGAALLGLLAMAVTLAGCGGSGGSGDSSSSGAASTSVAPLTLPGPYPIACSNVAQDFSGAAQSAAQVQAYWEGRPAADASARYATDLLTDPVNTLASHWSVAITSSMPRHQPTS